MGYTDLVGQEQIAYKYVVREDSKLPAGRGVMPGAPLRKVLEGDEDILISGRGVIP